MRACKSLNIFMAVLVLAGFAVGQNRQNQQEQKGEKYVGEVGIIPAFQGKWGKGSPVAPLTGGYWKDKTEGHGWVKPDPNFKPTYTPDGQVDIQGTWASIGFKGGGQVPISQVANELEAQKTGAPKAPPKTKAHPPIPDQRPVYNQDMRAKTSAGRGNFVGGSSTCLPGGIGHFISYLDNQIIQSPGEVLIIAEHLTNFRHIPLDGRPPLSDKIKLWLGDSRGRWEKNTLIVDAKNNNDMANMGNSDAMYMQERFTPVAQGIMQYEARVEDPIVYTKGYNEAYPLLLTPNYESFEENCSDGNRYTMLQFKSGKTLYPGFWDVVAMGEKKLKNQKK